MEMEAQGRKGTKRAEQNRIAQRAFRERKAVYMKELEQKADNFDERHKNLLCRNATFDSFCSYRNPIQRPCINT